MQRMEIVIGSENVPDPLGRPQLDLGAKLASVELRVIQNFVAVVGLGYPEPAGDRRNPRQARLGDGGADVFDARLGERPQRLGMIQPDAAHQPVHGTGKAGQHEAIVAAGRARCDAVALQHRDRPSAPCDLAGGRQTGKAGANDADVSIEIVGERRARGRRHHGGRVPGRRIGRALGGVHVSSPQVKRWAAC